MLEIIFALIMGVLARMAGGGMWAPYLNKKGAVDDDGRALGGLMPYNLTFLPALLFAIPFGFVSPFGFIAIVISYLGMQAATGPGIGWGDNPHRAQQRQALTPVVEFFTKRLGFATGDINYCRVWMVVKGFLIGLPVGAVPLAILWPLSYEIGYRLKPIIGRPAGHATAEFLTGVSAAISILIIA